MAYEIVVLVVRKLGCTGLVSTGFKRWLRGLCRELNSICPTSCDMSGKPCIMQHVLHTSILTKAGVLLACRG